MRSVAALIFACLLPGLLLWSPSSAAATYEANIAAAQGSLASGELPSGSTLSAVGTKVATYLADDGRFLIGFNWDAPPKVTLIINGERRTVMVEQRKFKLERVDGLPPQQVTPSKEDLRAIKRDAAAITAARRLAVGGFPSLRWRSPSRGRISGVFGSRRVLNGEMRSPHKGLDIAAPRGTPINAPLGGEVTLAAAGMFYTGNTVMLAHGGGLTSIYAHLGELAVGEGERVEVGQLLGSIGSSGRASGPHLHWGVYLGSVALDPQLLLNYATAAN